MVELVMNVQCLRCNRKVASKIEIEMMSAHMTRDEEGYLEVSCSDYSPSKVLTCPHCNTLIEVGIHMHATDITRMGMTLLDINDDGMVNYNAKK